jgi:hypothetical protein
MIAKQKKSLLILAVGQSCRLSLRMHLSMLTGLFVFHAIVAKEKYDFFARSTLFLCASA